MIANGLLLEMPKRLKIENQDIVEILKFITTVFSLVLHVTAPIKLVLNLIL